MKVNKLVCVFLVTFAVFAGTASNGRQPVNSQTRVMADGGAPPPPPWKPHVA